MDTQTELATIRRMFTEMDSGNLSILDELSHPSFALHFPGVPAPLPAEAAKGLIGAFYAAFPDLRHELVYSVVEDGKAAVLLRITGTHQADFQGLARTDRPVDFFSHTLFRFADGKVIDQWVEFDTSVMFKQLSDPAPQAEVESAQPA
jgi:hypothetical protein